MLAHFSFHNFGNKLRPLYFGVENHGAVFFSKQKGKYSSAGNVNSAEPSVKCQLSMLTAF